MVQKLGQHFLTRPEIARWVVDAGGVTKDDTVLEIGPGHGILTEELLLQAKRVVAIEKDVTLISELKKKFKEHIESGALILKEEDVRDFNPLTCPEIKEGYKLVANIPYYITGKIIRQFLTSELQPDSIAILIQKEVAVRIVARDNKHSILSLSVHVYGKPTLEKIVKAGAFSPPPKVDSAILSIKEISKQSFEENGAAEERFFEIIKTAFSQKRKIIGGTLKNVVSADVFASCSIDPKTRPEDVSLEKWLCLGKF
jgi:16S rRNA (adenine1518-N6/adenine1519-N6)-dimethyltransferase